MITREFDLMLYQEGNLLFINANQYDSGEQWIFTLYEENGVKYTPATGAIVGVKSDGHGIINTGTVDQYGRVVINETQQMTAAAGLATFELLIDNDTHGTANFKVDVEPRPADNADLSDSDLSLIQEAVDSAAEIIDLLDGETVDEKLLPIVQSETSDWLTEHITNPSNPPIDTSLTVAGAAADAKKTGDEITDLKNDIDNIIDIEDVSAHLTFYPRWLNSQNVWADNPDRRATDYLSIDDFGSVALNTQGLFAYVVTVSSDKSSLINLENLPFGHTWKPVNSEAWYVIEIASTNTDALTILRKNALKQTCETVNENNRALHAVEEVTQQNILADADWSNSSINTTNGTYFHSANRIASTQINIQGKSKIKCSVDIGYKYYVFFYSEEEFISCTGWKTNSETIELPINATKAAFALATTNDETIDTSAATHLGVVAETNLYSTIKRLDAETAVPSYWKTYLDSKVNDIKQLVEESDDVFAFVTDIHVPENQMHTPDLIRYIQSKIDIPNVFNNGDYIDSNSSRRAAIDVIDTWVTKTGTSWKVIRGNHDTNYQGTGTVTEKDFSGHTTKRLKNDVTLMAENRNIYYYDNEQAKIRYLFLDTVEEGTVDISDQVNWMKARITELASGWSVIVITHMYFAPATVSSGVTTLGVLNVGAQIKSGLDDVYDTASAKIIAYICGHCHRDYSITTEKGYPIISTTCDAGGTQASYYDINYPTRTVGTTNEQAFDIYGINKSTNTITALRIGAGAASRQFTFN